MNFKQFEAFYWLTRLKSYQRVAEQINLTQPAVSVRVLGLEESLGVKLIESHAPNFKLTEKGHQAAEFAEAFINLQERMLMSLKADAATPLHIGMVEPAMMTWGARFLDALNVCEQPVQTRLSTGSNYDLQRLTAEGILDIVFATASMGGPALADTFRVRYRTGWVGHPRLAPDTGQPLTQSDLAQLNLAFFARSTQQASPSIANVAKVRAATTTESTSTSYAGTCELVRRGFGFAPLALAPLAPELDAGDLVELEVADPLPALEVRCVFMNRSRQNRVQQVYDAAAEAAAAWCADYPAFVSFVPV